MPEAIPPSPYPVLGMYGGGSPPRKTLDGPYVASRPAYQIFANMAATGQSVSQFVEGDHRPNEVVDFDRFNPVKEYGSRGYWFHDGEMEMLPNWPNPNEPAKAAPAEAAPAPAPAAAPLLPPAGGPAVMPAPKIAPAAPVTAPTTPKTPLALPAEPGEDVAAAARAPDAHPPARTVQVAARGSSKARASRLVRQLASQSYNETIPVSYRTRASQRPQVAGSRRVGSNTL